MSLTLTTFGASDPIDATELRARNESVRRYVGEEILATDRAAGALLNQHVYRPDFMADRAVFTSGEHYWSSRPDNVPDQLFWTSYVSTSGSHGFYIPNLTRTISIPENISTNGGHRVKVQTSFAIWEFGGNADATVPACDESTYVGWTVGLAVNGSWDQVQTGCKGSWTGGTSAGGGNAVPFYPRKQMCLVRDLTLNAGVHDIGMMIFPNGNEALVRHRIVGQGWFLVGYNCR